VLLRRNGLGAEKLEEGIPVTPDREGGGGQRQELLFRAGLEDGGGDDRHLELELLGAVFHGCDEDLPSQPRLPRVGAVPGAALSDPLGVRALDE
jgi:hypothetical protein